MPNHSFKTITTLINMHIVEEFSVKKSEVEGKHHDEMVDIMMKVNIMMKWLIKCS